MASAAPGLKDKGFLLFEVMVTLAVISIALVFIQRSFIMSLQALEASRDYTTAGILLEEKLFQIETDKKIQPGYSEGMFDGQEKFGWKLKAEGVKNYPLVLCDVKAHWRCGRRGYQIDVSSLFRKEEETAQ